MFACDVVIKGNNEGLPPVVCLSHELMRHNGSGATYDG